jgi:hypothetical protein
VYQHQEAVKIFDKKLTFPDYFFHVWQSIFLLKRLRTLWLTMTDSISGGDVMPFVAALKIEH